MSVVAVSDTAALAAALKTAQPGDVIALAPGRYVDVVLKDLNFASAVTITSQDLGAPAEIVGLGVNSSSGLTFRGLTIVSDPAQGDKPNLVIDSARITFDDIDFHGSLNGDPGDDVGGLQIRLSTDVAVTGSTFEELRWGISHLDNNGLTIRDNDFHDLRMDGVRGGGSSNVTIANNSFRDFFIAEGDHGDAIQFWTNNVLAAAHDIRIENNIFVRGDGHFVQGIFFRDEAGDMPYERVTIRGNLLVGSAFNGIVVGNGRDVTVEDNVVQSLAGQDAYIRLVNVEGLTLSNNQALKLKIIDSTDVVETGNVVLGPVGDGGKALVGEWLASKVTTVSGGYQDDVLTGSATGSVMRGGDGNDILRGSANFDDIHGNQGADTASGGSGNDWVVGGKDNDWLSGDAGDDLVFGNLGNDICDGGAGADTLRGGQDDDLVRGGPGDDYLSGDKGIDTLTGGAGADVFHSFGDAGVDRITDFNLAEGDRILLDADTTWSVSQVGLDTVISMAGGGQVVLMGVAMSSLTGDWIGAG